MRKNDPFRSFENADDDFIEKMSDTPRLNNIEKERMFAMSKNIYNNMKGNTSEVTEINTGDGVEGVERYSRPIWYKPLISIAACLAVAAGIAGTALIMKNHRGGNGVVNEPDIVATQVTTLTTGTDNTEISTETTSVTTDVSSDILNEEENRIKDEIAENARKAEEEAAEKAAKEAEQRYAAAQSDAATNNENNTVTTAASESNSMLMSRGQQMFEVACRKYWGYRSGSVEIFDAGEKVGEPYYDENGVLRQGVEWTMTYDENGQMLGTVINDPDIKTVDDAVARYYETFSERYPDNIENYFKEYNGKVYWLTGQRGSNQFYLASVITEVQRQTDDEIFFTIEHHYDPEIEQYGVGQSLVKETFSVVIQPDGSWKVGQFHLPY